MLDKNTLFYGDNLDVLPRIAAGSVDLIYLDPPFKSDRKYNAIFQDFTGDPSSAQIHAFDDTWKWGTEAEAALASISTGTVPPDVAVFIHAMYSVLGKSDMMAYLVMMAPRLVQMRRVLKETGSIYLHCDPTASHYLKMLMDAVFGVKNFINEVVWHYTGGGRSKTYFSRKHDIIFVYASVAGRQAFNVDDIRVPYKETSGYAKGGITSKAGKKYMPNPLGTPVDDVWDIPIINPLSHERLGYPTQKPLSLLERIIAASCPPYGVVLDPFCGCGTALDAAQKLRRRWIGIDITYLAVDLISNRLVGRYGKGILGTFAADGIPQDFEGATALAARNKIDFERWVVSRLSGQPTPASGDKGVDGWVYFARTYKEPLDVGKVVVSVKGGESPTPGWVRDLSGTVTGRDAQMGVLVSLRAPTAGMSGEAASNGSYVHEATGSIYPKIQLMTVADILAGKQPKVPSPLPPYQQASWAAASVAVPLF